MTWFLISHFHSVQLGLAPALAQSASGLVCHCSSIQAVFVPAGVVVHGVHVHQLFDPHSVWLRLEQDFRSFLGTTLQYSLVVFL